LTQTRRNRQGKQSLVAFLDILGTEEMVRNDEFDDFQSLDFVNPVCIMARYNPKLRFAVFSDSVIVASPTDDASKFVSVLSFLYTQWFADYVLVRGGVSVGEIRWVDQPSIDGIFRGLPNLAYARVYGKALVEAHRLEQRSGPGAICFVDEKASELLRTANDNYVLLGQTDALIWTDRRQLENWCKVSKFYLDRQKVGTEARRHMRATAEETKGSGVFSSSRSTRRPYIGWKKEDSLDWERIARSSGIGPEYP
jgi:hypothetical protein